MGKFLPKCDLSIVDRVLDSAYQVYLGNTRGIFEMGHTSFSNDDPRFWGMYNSQHIMTFRNLKGQEDWTIRDLAAYDFPALVNHVCNATGYSKVYLFYTPLSHLPNSFHVQIAFIGHSQGNGLAFLSLSKGLRPDIGQKLSLFVALAPAVYAGPLTHGLPFTLLRRVHWNTWQWLFGKKIFILHLGALSTHIINGQAYWISYH